MPLIFAANPLDRAAHHRSDEAFLRQALASGRGFLLPFHQSHPLIAERAGFGWLDPAPFAGVLEQQAFIFLGLDKKSRPHFAAELGQMRRAVSLIAGQTGQQPRYGDLRTLAAAGEIAAGDLAIAAQARALLLWHESHRFCARCGGESKSAEAGHKRICPSCGGAHFPRTDPVVIMLARHQGQVFLARQEGFPPGMVSAPAGFIEPGETIEEAVARELWEEARICCSAVRYHAAQPWPFPYSLMIGCFADADSADFTLPENGELAQGRWFARAELAAMLAGGESEFWLPPKLAIARQLVEAHMADS